MHAFKDSATRHTVAADERILERMGYSLRSLYSQVFCNGEPLTTLLVLMVALAPVSDAVARVMLPLRNWTVPSATGSPVGVVTWVPYPSR